MKHFTVIEFLQEKKCFDFPKRLPIPRIGETIIFNECDGWVVDIVHNIQGKVSETRIKVINKD